MIGKFNPLNIRTSAHYTWNGQVGATRGFCDFSGIEFCRRAGAYLLMRSYQRAGIIHLDDVIKRWAPPTENCTNAYIDFVCKQTEFGPRTLLVFDSDFAAVLAAMEIFEQGVPASHRANYYATAKASYLFIINNFNIKRYEAKS